MNNPNCDQQSLWNRFIKPITFIIVAISVACAVSQLKSGNASSPDDLHNFWADIRSIKASLNIVTRTVEELGLSRKANDRKIDEIALIIPRLVQATLKLREDVSEEMAQHTNKVLQTLTPSIDYIRNMIKEEIKLYDADKTGLTDFALESAGGAIISTRDTESFTGTTPALTLFGVALCHHTNTPRAIIQANVFPGECWAFAGSCGSVVIQLLGRVQITSVSLEHIPRSLSPTKDIMTAPRDFSVWGLNCLEDKEGFFFGQFTYDEKGEPLQRFNIQHQCTKPYPIVELKIHSNHGHPAYTCVYRFRVHGQLEPRQSRGLR